jgi:hypothetical protein
MRLVLASLHLSWLGGATTYLLTVAPALQRLGHAVTLYSPDPGDTAELARARGIEVVSDEDGLPDDCDAVLVQDTVLAFELGARLGAPQVFVSHGAELDLAVPPQIDDAVAAVVAMNDRVAARVAALATRPKCVRLRQPIDIERFYQQGPPRERPAEVLLLGNYLRGQRRAVVTDACEELGLRYVQLGRDGKMAPEPVSAIGSADIVIGYGRSILEAMACGRAAYVLDHLGGDGWVTADSYPAMERDGFTGMQSGRQPTPEELRADLMAYDPGMGLVNESLIVSHHSSFAHARELSELLMSVAGGPSRKLESGRELARLTRMQWHADWRFHELERDVQAVRVQLREQEQRTMEAERRAAELASTLRWRAAQRALAPIDRVRARVREMRRKLLGRRGSG